MFVLPGKCPVCYSQWTGKEYCSTCGCLVEFQPEFILPTQEKLNHKLIQKIIDATRLRLQQYPYDAAPRYALAMSYINFNLIQEGLAEIKRVIDLWPEKIEIRFEWILISAKYCENNDEILNQLNIVINRRPDFLQARYYKGVILEQKGSMGDAVKEWQIAYQIDKQYKPAINKLLNFIASEKPSITTSHLEANNLDATSQEYIKLLTASPLPEPLPLGKTSLNLLNKISENTARRMVKIYKKRVQEYQQLVNQYNLSLQRMEDDLIGLSNLCLISYRYKKNLPIQQTTSTRLLTIKERSAILDNVIQGYLRSGYRVVTRSDTYAQLYKPKEFDFCTALIMVILVVGIIIYLIYYITKKDDVVYLQIDEYGRLKTTHP